MCYNGDLTTADRYEAFIERYPTTPAVMLGRVFTKLGGTISAVSSTAFADDGSVAGWAKSEVAFMSGKDIVKGVGDNKFAPTKALSIQEAVIMANRMLETLK